MLAAIASIASTGAERGGSPFFAAGKLGLSAAISWVSLIKRASALSRRARSASAASSAFCSAGTSTSSAS